MWQALLARRPALGEPLRFWTAILEGWAGWKPPASLVPLAWSPDECRARWERGVSLLAEARPVIPSASIEDLLGPVMERLAADGPEAVEAFRRLAHAWDDGQIDASALLPAPDRDPAAWLLDRFGLRPFAAMRPEALSGGFKRRLMIARALVAVLLLALAVGRRRLHLALAAALGLCQLDVAFERCLGGGGTQQGPQIACGAIVHGAERERDLEDLLQVLDGRWPPQRPLLRRYSGPNRVRRAVRIRTSRKTAKNRPFSSIFSLHRLSPSGSLKRFVG